MDDENDQDYQQQPQEDEQSQQGPGRQERATKFAREQARKGAKPVAKGAKQAKTTAQKGAKKVGQIKKELNEARRTLKDFEKSKGRWQVALAKTLKRRLTTVEGLKATATRSLLTNPIFLGILAFLLLIITIILFFAEEGSEELKKQDTDEQSTLSLTKTGPEAAGNGDEFTYEILVKETGTVSEILIIDHLPKEVAYVSSEPEGVYDSQPHTVTWKLSEIKDGEDDETYAGVTETLSVTVEAANYNTNIVNYAEATSTYAKADVGGYVPPSESNCGGKYPLNNSINKNFGDPDCNFDKDQLFQILKDNDPNNANLWFNKIIPCESGYNPNAYNGAAVDAAGAWGLFQMGSSNPPGQEPTSPGKNGVYDRGDIIWSIQATNAVNYGKQIDSLAAYWACAR